LKYAKEAVDAKLRSLKDLDAEHFIYDGMVVTNPVVIKFFSHP